MILAGDSFSGETTRSDSQSMFIQTKDPRLRTGRGLGDKGSRAPASAAGQVSQSTPRSTRLMRLHIQALEPDFVINEVNDYVVSYNLL